MPQGPKPDAADPERRRLDAMRDGTEDWRVWGPYVSDRQWGTVREDYSEGGDAWNYFTHDQARSRAYRWGEDGIAGFCDDRQLLCLSLALWNGRDPILKERLFGLTNLQGNHGEDVKELYYYVDAVPSHAYQRMLYKYVQSAYPYQWLIDENARRRGTEDREFELIDTGLFDRGRYFDVEVEYAKAAPDDILMRITVHNRGQDAAPIWILPQAWFRNEWSWSDDYARPDMREERPGEVIGSHDLLGPFTLNFEAQDRLIFCDNDTNYQKVFGAAATARLPQGRDSTNSSSTAGPTRSTRTDEAPKSPAFITGWCLGAEPWWCECGCVMAAAASWTSPASMRWWTNAARRPTLSTPFCKRISPIPTCD